MIVRAAAEVVVDPPGHLGGGGVDARDQLVDRGRDLVADFDLVDGNERVGRTCRAPCSGRPAWWLSAAGSPGR
jgi:hypothetical protein